MSSAAVVTNLLESATLTPDSVDSNFPASYLVDRIAGTRFSFGTTTGGVIDIDLGAVKAFDTIGIINHNFTAAVALSLTDNESPANTLSSLTYLEESLWKYVGSQSERYLRLVVTDTNTEDVAFGQLVLGSRIVLPRAHRFGKTVGKERGDIVHETVRGSIFAYHLFERKVRDYQWRILASEITNFETIDDAILGRLRPFLWIPDTSGTEVLYVRRTSSSFRPVELSDLDAYDIAWSVQQESNGSSVEE